MHRTAVHLIVSLAVTPWAGCGKSSPDSGQRKPTSAGIIALDPPTTGTIGHNGLRPEDLLDNLRNLELAMGDSLTVPPPGTLHSKFAPFIPKYRTLADDAISCTVDSTRVTLYGGAPYSAAGAYHPLYPRPPLLHEPGAETAAMWDGAKLSPALQEDVYTCLATRLNPSATVVDIWLGGHQVTENHAAPPPIDEALWATTILAPGSSESTPPRIQIDVWPSQTLIDSCPKLSDAVQTRVCGKPPPATCGPAVLMTHTDRSACVQGADRLYTCSSGAHSPDVIWTRLACASWCTLYPSCSVPKGCSNAGTPCQ